MNSLVRSMPIVATEMQRMNANISLVTASVGVMMHSMDSSMGRMGRWHHGSGSRMFVVATQIE